MKYSFTLAAFVLTQVLCTLARPVDKETTSGSSSIKKGKHFDRVVIVVMENQNYDVAYKDKFLNGLHEEYKNGIMLTNYLGTTHPSQPNYVSLQLIFLSPYHLQNVLNHTFFSILKISMISGSTKGTKENDESNIDRKTIVDLLEAKDISWKTYQEDYPGNE